MSQRQRLDRSGFFAIEPQALSLDFAEVREPPEPFKREGVTAVVDVCGPLMSRNALCFDSYESIVARVRAAFESDARAVLLRIDSPGGLVSGCFAASRQLRAMALEHPEKPLVAYVDETATSAAYALASAASRIVIPPTGRCGSIGVIECLPSFARAESAAGVDVTVIMSGARKADGNPSLPMTDEARAALQQGVDQMARAFCELVAAHRGGSPEQFANLQAGVYYGADAVKQQLADDVSELPALLADIATNPEKYRMKLAMTFAEALTGLKALAEGEGEDADKAKKALAALDAPPAEDDEEEEKPAAKAAEGDEEEAPPSEKKEAPAATIAALSATVQALASESADRKKRDAAELKAKRAALFAGRPDLAPELVKALASASLEDCEAAIAKLPRPNPAAAAGVTGTQGATGVRAAAAVGVALTESQLKICAEQGIDPADYARTLATFAPAPSA